jgi:hypothetical protein
MKAVALALGGLLLFSSVQADEILNKTSSSILDLKKQKGKKQANINKDSWINPLNIEADISKSKSANSDQDIQTKKLSINFSQEIYKSGAIKATIKKGKLENYLNTSLVGQEKKQLLSTLYGNVIDLKKIDLEIKKLYYLISNKKIEIAKNEASYTNGLLDITVLDESVIELSDLKNQKEDFSLQKIKILKEFQKHSDLNYKKISLDFLLEVDMKKFVSKNKNIEIKKLQLEQNRLDKTIVNGNYLPKVSLYGNGGYEKNDLTNKGDDYYNYGLKVTMPFDYNGNKNKELSKLNTLLAKKELEQTKKYEKDFYTYTIQTLKFLDNKIINLDETIHRYQNLYKNVNALYESSLKTIEDVQIMENRVNSTKLNKQILQLDKKAILNQIYARIS